MVWCVALKRTKIELRTEVIIKIFFIAMAKITKLEYENALSICNEYLKQETEVLSIVSDEIKRLNELQDKSKRLDILKNWIDINKGDEIKMINPPKRNGNILKEGEILKVKRIDKQTFEDYRKLEIKIWAKINAREYLFKGKLYKDDVFSSNCVFEKCN